MTRAFTPRTIDEAVRVLAENPGVKPLAGCTDLMVGAGEGRLTPAAIMDLTRVAELRGVEHRDGEWHLGAAATFTEIRQAPGLAEALPALADAASRIGGWQIQNRATVGGNMANASPAGDSLPVLLALEATVVMVGPLGTRAIPYDQFHVGYRKTALAPDEIIGWVRIPDPAKDSIQFFRKVGTREAQSISKVSVAMAAHLQGDRFRRVRFGVGSLAATPVRLCVTEKLCEGEAPGKVLAERAAETAMGEVHPIDDVRSTAEYRLHALGRVVRRMILESMERA